MKGNNSNNRSPNFKTKKYKWEVCKNRSSFITNNQSPKAYSNNKFMNFMTKSTNQVTFNLLKLS